MLKVIQRRLENFICAELPEEQAGFRKGRGTRDHISNMRMIMNKSHHMQKPLILCFIDYKKAFDCVDHQRLWKVLEHMGAPMHLIVLLQQLYDGQRAVVRTEHGDTEHFGVGKGVRQGCILSPILFNIYAEKIIRDALDGYEKGIKIGGRTISNLRYADDTSLLAETVEEMKQLIHKVKVKSEEAGLLLNLSKTKIMSNSLIREFQLNGEEIEVVESFQFLGVKLSDDG